MRFSDQRIPELSLTELQVPGCFSVRPRVHLDNRGRFVKTIHSTTLDAAGLPLEIREQYYSISSRNVLRGMHFQTPPHDHDKLVYCLAGKALDVVLDLRKGSPQFGIAISVTLDPAESAGLYVPRGCAHGFLSLLDGTMLLYSVTSEYERDHDLGIRWDSIPFEWPTSNPIVSDRDRCLPRLPEYSSPFIFAA